MTSNDLPIPAGFTGGSIACGLKPSGRTDLGLILSDDPAAFALVQTRNRFAGANIVLNRERLAAGAPLRGIVVHAGQANACTGAEGLALARRTAEIAADATGARPEEFLVGSTGVIGVLPKMKRIESGLADLKEYGLSEEGVLDVGTAMMTTDTRPKRAGRQLVIGGRTVTILGMAKGAGMIHPSMGTMLAWILTDASVEQPALRAMFARAAERSFNSVTVDGDTSTSDIAAVLANGAAGNEALDEAGLAALEAALTDVCIDLARQVAADGEGATKLLTVRVTGATTEADARRAAHAVAGSSLVKCAIFGRDPNWGRIAAALGATDVPFEPARVAIDLCGKPVFRAGEPVEHDKPAISKLMKAQAEIEIEVGLGAGDAQATVWSCDLTDGYVRINADYTT